MAREVLPARLARRLSWLPLDPALAGRLKDASPDRPRQPEARGVIGTVFFPLPLVIYT
jgi:hypothetical protein